MQSGEAFRFRVDPAMRRLLDRLRDERDVNLSAWVRRAVRDALAREFPAGDPAVRADPPQAPLPGWKPCKAGGQWCSALEGPAVASLPADPRGSLIAVSDRSGNSWTASVTAVVERSPRRIVVADSGRPGTEADRARERPLPGPVPCPEPDCGGFLLRVDASDRPARCQSCGNRYADPLREAARFPASSPLRALSAPQALRAA